MAESGYGRGQGLDDCLCHVDTVCLALTFRVASVQLNISLPFSFSSVGHVNRSALCPTCTANNVSLFLLSLAEHKCLVDQREQLEETLPLVLGLILGLVIVITLGVYHLHLKMTASQVQIPRDRSDYKHMG